MARGLLMVSPSVRHIAEFEDYFVRIDPRTPPPRDPFYQEAYMSENRCRLPGIDYQPYNGFPDCVIPSEQQRCGSSLRNVLFQLLPIVSHTFRLETHGHQCFVWLQS